MLANTPRRSGLKLLGDAHVALKDWLHYGCQHGATHTHFLNKAVLYTCYLGSAVATQRWDDAYCCGRSRCVHIVCNYNAISRLSQELTSRYKGYCSEPYFGSYLLNLQAVYAQTVTYMKKGGTYSLLNIKDNWFHILLLKWGFIRPDTVHECLLMSSNQMGC